MVNWVLHLYSLFNRFTGDKQMCDNNSCTLHFIGLNDYRHEQSCHDFDYFTMTLCVKLRIIIAIGARESQGGSFCVKRIV